jgi:hypothetical protein
MSALNAQYSSVWRSYTREVHKTHGDTSDILTVVVCQFKSKGWETKIRTIIQIALEKTGVPFRIVVIPSDENQPKVDTDVDGFVLVFGGSDESIRNRCFEEVRFYSRCYTPITVCMTRAGVQYDVVSCTPVDHSEPVVPEPVVHENTVGRVEMDVPFNDGFAHMDVPFYDGFAHLDVPFYDGFAHLDVPFNVGFAFRALQDMLSPAYDVLFRS